MKRWMKLFGALLWTACLLTPAARGAERAPEGEKGLTRGEFVILLWEDGGGVPFDKTAHPFTDISDDWVAQAVAWAYDLGLTSGVGDGLFAPDQPITREECAALLRRWDGHWGRDTFLPDGAAACNDYADISPWADDSLYWACITGRMGWRDGRLAPLEEVSRAEAEGYFTSRSRASQV